MRPHLRTIPSRIPSAIRPPCGRLPGIEGIRSSLTVISTKPVGETQSSKKLKRIKTLERSQGEILDEDTGLSI